MWRSREEKWKGRCLLWENEGDCWGKYESKSDYRWIDWEISGMQAHGGIVWESQLSIWAVQAIPMRRECTRER